VSTVRVLESDRLSTFRTQHVFLHYGEFRTVDEFLVLKKWAREQGVPLFILGNGSNTLFTRTNVRTLVVKNLLEESFHALGGDRYEVASSVPVMHVLKFCEKRSLDSFYFLASVPAHVGGALAMNAGAGIGKTIYDYVESVTFVQGDELVTKKVEEIERSHRQTMFTGVHDHLIVSAVFRFVSSPSEASRIRERALWAQANQDISFPNCGSVFKESYRPLLVRMRGLPPGGVAYPLFRAQYSRKVNNWIISRNKRSWPVVALIRFTQFLHWCIGKRAVPEIIEVG